MKFYKMHGAGNDFIMFLGSPSLTAVQIEKICHRRTGLGADGVIFVEKKSDKFSFIMHYYNSDGSKADFCGNGARCAFYLAKHLQYFPGDKASFLAGDGEHFGTVLSDSEVSISINNPKDFKHIGKIDDLPFDFFFVNTGVEHAVCFVQDLSKIDLETIGRKVRYNNIFPAGTNVNFVAKQADGILHIRTYERGVEAETLACGTGISAAAFTDMQLCNDADSRRIITVAGYTLSVGWQDKIFTLTGPAEIIAEGDLGV